MGSVGTVVSYEDSKGAGKGAMVVSKIIADAMPGGFMADGVFLKRSEVIEHRQRHTLPRQCAGLAPFEQETPGAVRSGMCRN